MKIRQLTFSTEIQLTELHSQLEIAYYCGKILQHQKMAFYIVPAAAPASRASDLATGDSAAGIQVVVSEGNVNNNRLFICTSNPGSDVVDTNSLTFSRATNDKNVYVVSTAAELIAAAQETDDESWIFLMPGTYTLSSLLNFTNDLKLIGAGHNLTTIRSDGVIATDIIRLSSNTIIRDINFDANGVDETVLSIVGGEDNIVIENCRFTGGSTSAAFTIQGDTAANATTEFRISNCIFTSCSGTCIRSSQSIDNNWTITNCYFTGFGLGAVNFAGTNLVFNNNAIESTIATTPIALTVSGDRVTISGNVLEASTNPKLFTGSGDNIVISNNVFNSSASGTSSECIAFTGTASNCVVSNNQINCTSGAAGVTAAISFFNSTGSQTALIDGNQISGTIDDQAITCANNTGTSNFTIINNYITATLTSGGEAIVVGSAISGTINGFVTGNTFSNADSASKTIDVLTTGTFNMKVYDNNLEDAFAVITTLNGYADRFIGTIAAGNVSATLADLSTESAGHRLLVQLSSAGGGDYTITPASASGFASIVLDAANDQATLEWNGSAWELVNTSGGTVVTLPSDTNYFVTTVEEIINALANISGNGAVVNIAPGVYTLTASLTVPANACLVGSGQEKTTIRGDASLNTQLVSISSSDNVCIRDITFDTRHATISTDCIDVAGSADLKIQNCTFTNSNGNTGIGIDIDGTSNNINIESCKFTSMSSGTGIDAASGATDLIIENNIIDTLATGLTFGGSNTGSVANNTITDSATNNVSVTSSPFLKILVNDSQSSPSDPSSINGYDDRVLVTTTALTSATLADLNVGSAGHQIYIELDVDVGDLTVTPTNAKGFSSVTFDTAGDFVVLEWNGTQWEVSSASNTPVIDDFNYTVNTFTELSNAITTITSSTNGGIINCAPGTYTFTSTLTISTNNVTIQGSGQDSTLFVADAALTTIMMNVSGTRDNIKIRDIKFDANASGRATDNSIIDFSSFVEHITIENCQFAGVAATFSAIDINIHENVIISQNHFESITTGIGVNLTNSGSTACRIENNHFKSWDTAIQIVSNEVTISNNDFQQNDIDISSSGDHNQFINNNLFNAGTTGINLASGATDTIISNNFIRSANNSIVVAASVTDIKISDNMITQSGATGITIGASVTGEISNNTINQSTTANYSISSTDPSLNFLNGTSVTTATGPATINGYDDKILLTTVAPGSTTLGNLHTGAAGHICYVELDVAAGTVTITPTTFYQGTSIDLTSAGEYAVFQWNGVAWTLIATDTNLPTVSVSTANLTNLTTSTIVHQTLDIKNKEATYSASFDIQPSAIGVSASFEVAIPFASFTDDQSIIVTATGYWDNAGTFENMENLFAKGQNSNNRIFVKFTTSNSGSVDHHLSIIAKYTSTI